MNRAMKPPVSRAVSGWVSRWVIRAIDWAAVRSASRAVNQASRSVHRVDRARRTRRRRRERRENGRASERASSRGRRWRRALVAVCMGGVVLTACASGSRGNGTDRDLLSREEIESVDVSNLYEVVQRLRPRWLEVRATRSAFDSRDTQIVVYMDRTYLGGVSELRGLGVDAALRMEFMSGSEASASLPGIGSRQVDGAIVVHTIARR